jgi:hypothetical protein
VTQLSQLAPYLTGPVAALAVLVTWIIAERRDKAELRKALEDERKRADSAEEAARTVNSLLTKILEGRKIR